MSESDYEAVMVQDKGDIRFYKDLPEGINYKDVVAK